jgi:hypothetical protein
MKSLIKECEIEIKKMKGITGKFSFVATNRLAAHV